METSIHAPATGTFAQAVTPLSTLWFMVLHDTSPKQVSLRSFPPLLSASAVKCETLLFKELQFSWTLRHAVLSPFFHLGIELQ